MRIQLDHPVAVWLLFFLIIVPIFIASLEKDLLPLDVRISTWFVMFVFIYIFYQFYLVQGGSFFGKGILG